MEKKNITISILIPAYNEEAMISACVHSCLAQTRIADQIVVVNDGSTDATAKVLESFGGRIQVVSTPGATGNKSRAQEMGLPYVTGDIVVTTDADTILDPNFIAIVEDTFLNDPSTDVVSGYVQSTKYNLWTALREIDYVIGQDIFKYAQSCLHFLLVIPGCAGAFRTSLFRDGSISFDHDTITEDLDFTYKLNTLGKKIVFNRNAKVYTQDPPTLHSYVNQMRRWYGGHWQNLRKHLALFRSRPSAVFTLASTIEGLFFNVALFVLPLLNLYLFGGLLLMYFSIGVCMGMYAAIRRKRLDLLLVSPLMPVMTVINAFIFLEQFVVEVVLRRANMKWFHPERLSPVDSNLMKI